ncbi:MAG TPA: hypothetical protein VKP30_21620 [Polyangiaceae bacterium]|nr:hypothetical protein [Polyangiaceae bacterium]
MQQNDAWVTIRFEESEAIVAFGTKRTTFRVRLEQGWTEVSRVASATIKKPNTVPGVVWSRIVELRLRVGTEVERCIDSPSPQRHVGTFESLVRGASAKKVACRRDRFSVNREGRLNAINPEK